jgi:DNA polymerase III epsilon subunit-like protein
VNKIKYCFLDLETTGVIKPGPEVKNSEIIEIGMILDNPENGKTYEWKSNVRPFNYEDPEIYSESALEKNGITIEEIKKFPEPMKVFSELQTILNRTVNKYDPKDKLILIGYNLPKFDELFLRWWFEKCGEQWFGSYFWHPSLDVAQLAMLSCFEIRSTFPNFKLETVAKSFGINLDESKLHGALYDTKITRELFYKVIGS